MRVTQNANYDLVRENIRRSRERMEGLQRQSATLKKLNTPSDDPVGAAKVMEMRTDKVNNDQFILNAKLAETFLANTDLAVSELGDIIVRAKEIAIGQSSGASSNEDTRLGIAEEVTQLFNNSITVGNRRVGERYLFGGYQTHKPPIEADGRYKGDEGQMMAEIGHEVFLAMNVPGVDVFNTRPSDSRDRRSTELQAGRGLASEAGDAGAETQNVNLFEELQTLRIGLLTGDLETIRGTLERFDALQTKLLGTRAKIGSRINGLQSSTQSLERHTLTNAGLSSTLEDADMAQVVSDLAKEETVFRSALQSSQKLLQPSLLDFLK